MVLNPEYARLIRSRAVPYNMAAMVSLYTSARAMDIYLWLTYIRKFFRRSYIRVYNLDRKLAEAAQNLVWNQGIKPKDAIRVATAIHLKADVLETFDQDLIGKSGMDWQSAIEGP